MERTNPARSAGPDGGARPFGSFWGDCQKELAQQGETMPSNGSINEPKTEPKVADDWIRFEARPAGCTGPSKLAVQGETHSSKRGKRGGPMQTAKTTRPHKRDPYACKLR